MTRAGGAQSAVVAGLGAMGSAVAYHLARRGVRVTGLDRHRPPHTLGSSHGESRIIREAYFEHPGYVPLVQRAYHCWLELERETGRDLLTRTGALTIGRPDGELFAGAARSACEHDIPHDVLDSRQITDRFPQLSPAAAHVAVHERRAGILRPEACVEAHLGAAEAHGAELRYDEPVMDWHEASGGVRVTTRSATYHADLLVLATGAWLPRMMPDLPLEVERQVMAWFRPAANGRAFLPDAFPVFLWETEPRHVFYGFPDLGSGVKVARHHGGATATDPDALNPRVMQEDTRRLREFLESYIPDAAGDPAGATVCRYTNTPSGRFLIDRHPEAPRVTVVSACSGHGFKFASAIGESVAAQMTTGQTASDLRMFGWGMAV